MSESVNTDVLIVGAGMVGATFASALLQGAGSVEGRTPSVMMVEPASIKIDDEPYQPGFDTRSTALSAGTVEWFEKMGLWQEMSAYATAIKRIHISDQGRLGAARLGSEEVGTDALGYVVENPWAGRVFNRRLKELPGFTLWDESAVTEVRPQEKGVSATVRSNRGEVQTVHAGLIVIAEGGRSGLAESLGIALDKTPYDQTAVISNVVTEKPHLNQAWERFTEKGPLALLPLSIKERQNRHALIWTHPTAQAEEILQSTEEEFLNRLQLDFGFRLGRFVKAGERLSYPLSLVTAAEQARPGIVLLGNSAHTLHPVAGQGFNLAFRDALVLAELLVEGAAQGCEPGDSQLLADFAERTAKDQLLTIGFSHYLTKLFSSSGPASRVLRRSGLLATELFPAARSTLARQAMGMNNRKVSLRL